MWTVEIPLAEKVAPLFSRQVLLGLGACQQTVQPLKTLPVGGASVGGKPPVAGQWLPLFDIDSQVKSYCPVELSRGGPAGAGTTLALHGAHSLLYFLRYHQAMDWRSGRDADEEYFQRTLCLERRLVNAVDSVCNVAMNSDRDLGLLTRQFHQLMDSVDAVDAHLSANLSAGVDRLAAGEKVSLADAALVPALWYCHRTGGLPSGPFPSITKYLDASARNATVASLVVSPKIQHADGAAAASDNNAEATESPALLRTVMEIVKESNTAFPTDSFVHHREGSQSRSVLTSQRTPGRLGFQASTPTVKWTAKRPIGVVGTPSFKNMK